MVQTQNGEASGLVPEVLHFCGSIRGGRSDRALYADIIDNLREHGTVLTEHVGSVDVETEEMDVSDREIHDQDVAWLRRADAVVAEVTTPSLGVGYELGLATEQGTPVLALYRPASDHALSAMVRGNPAVTVVEYEDVAAVAPDLRTFLNAHQP